MRRWSEAERRLLLDYLGQWSRAALARRLGRSEAAVRNYCQRTGLAPTRQLWVTSGVAAALTGYTPQYLTRLARAGRVVARPNRTPLEGRRTRRRWWLFRASTLPRRDVAS